MNADGRSTQASGNAQVHQRACRRSQLLAMIGAAAMTGSAAGAGGPTAPGLAAATRSYGEVRFDLSHLPAYRPRQAVSGWLRVHGAGALAQGRLANLWEAGFRTFHPDVHFSYLLAGKEMGLSPLYYRQADIAVAYEPGFYDILPYERIMNSQPLRVEAFTGSLDAAGYARPFEIIVNRANPMTRITMDQLDGIFGAARDGGWVGTAWRSDRARGKDGNLRRWGQLGLTGDWTGRTIDPVGFSPRDPLGVAFNDRVLAASSKWNERLRTYGNVVGSGSAIVTAETQIEAAVVANPNAIAFTLGGCGCAGVKVLAVQGTPGGPFVPLSLATVRDRSYPLYRTGKLYVNLRPNGRPAPLVEEFLRYVLSREGQQAVVQDGKFLPLDRAAIAAQSDSLETLIAASARRAGASPANGEDAEASLHTQAARARVIARRGEQRMYPEGQFDLSDLPPYRPRAILDGWIRIHGDNYIETGQLRRYWEESFAKFQPNIRISWFLPTAAVGLSALYYDQADLLLSAERGLTDNVAYQKFMGRRPFAIEAYTGSYDLPGWANAPVILVNEKNPLARISMEQLDGVFGAERNGGWKSDVWHPEFARGADRNIRTWGQLGLGGDWADQPIHVYGFNLRYNTALEFSDRILQGSDKWNEDLITTGNYTLADGTRISAGDFIGRSVAKDPYAIAFTNFSQEYQRPGEKPLDLAEKTGGTYVSLSIVSARERSYPWVHQNSFYLNATPGTPMDPLVKEFLRFVLSREGQAAVSRDGKYLPLTAPLLAAQRAKLEAAWGAEPR